MRYLMRLLAPLIFWSAYAAFRSSLLQRSQRKHHLVMKLFRYAADNGHIKALSVYGHLLHFRGDGLDNRIQGGIYLQRAADGGDQKACYQMGRIFEQGFEHYFQVDQSKAFNYFRLAAEKGHPLAVKRLVEAYEEGGLGQSVDQQQSLYWQGRLTQPSD